MANTKITWPPMTDEIMLPMDSLFDALRASEAEAKISAKKHRPTLIAIVPNNIKPTISPFVVTPYINAYIFASSLT